MKDERKNLNSQLEMWLWVGLGCLGVHLYVELHSFFASMGLSSPLSDTITGKFAQSNLFTTPWTMKLMGGACISAYGVTNRGVKSVDLKTATVIRAVLLGLVLYVGSTLILRGNSQWLLHFVDMPVLSVVYLTLTIAGMLYLIKGTHGISRLLNFSPDKDKFNRENETFPQEERLLENDYSVNIPTEYDYKGKRRRGWLNISAVFRALLVMGSAGSGKSYGIINTVIRKHISKGMAVYVYDYKYPTLSLVAYNAVLKHHKKLPKDMKFYNINFDDPRKSHRCNPMHPAYMPNIQSAIETASTVLMNLNRNWIQKKGDYFVESPINYVAALIWFLRTYDKGQYCTFPHLIELVTINYRELLPILTDHPDLRPLVAPFASAQQGGALDQLEGQISSAQIGLARLSSPALYWVLSANDFMLDINNKKEPKILCLGNNQALEGTYGAALGLINFRIMTEINQPNRHASSLVVDELPTIYFKGIAKLIQTARSNKVAVTIGLQDFSQLELDYGQKEAESIKNTCGNIVSGQVFDKTAEVMQNRLGKSVQRKESINIQSEDTTKSISTELNWMVPAAKMGMLTQGWMVGVVADNVGQESDYKAFHARIAIDTAEFEAEQKAKELPNFSTFAEDDAALNQLTQENYVRIKDEIAKLVTDELARLNQKYPKK